MPRGGPDGNIQPFQFASQVVDPGAIYQMLWGFSPIDSQGRVVYLDTFNNGLGGWKETFSGSAASPTLITPSLLAFSPPNAVLISPGVTNGDLAAIYRETYMGKTKRIGVEIGVGLSFTATQRSASPYVSIDYRPIGLPAKFGRIQFDMSTGDWNIRVLGATNQSFYTPGVPASTVGILMQFKLVMDFETGKYVKAYIGDQDFDLSNYEMQASSSAYDGLLIVTARGTSWGANSLSFYLGYVLLTKDEP